MPQENFTFIDRTLIGWGDGSTPNRGQSVNSDTTYVYTAAHYPLPYPPQGAHPANTRFPANTLYMREFIRLSDLLTARQGLTFPDRSIVGWDSGSPNAGQPVNINTTYILVAAHYPLSYPPQGAHPANTRFPANTLYIKEFIKISDLLNAQQGLTFPDRGVIGWDSGSPNTGRAVNIDTTYVYTPALYPAPLQGRPANTIYTPEFIRLSDVLSALR